MRFNSEAERQSYAAWNDAMVELADHELDCTGCQPFTSHCPAGQQLKAVNDERWHAFHRVRSSEVTVA